LRAVTSASGRDVAEAKAKEINAAYVEGMRVRSRYGGTQRPYSS
jgi:hypothetical protein